MLTDLTHSDQTRPLAPLRPTLSRNYDNEASVPLRGDPNNAAYGTGTAGQGQSTLIVLCRTLRLRLLAQLFRRWDRGLTEQAKVAMTENRWYAVLRSLIHLVPIVAALTLIALNCSYYYVGGELAGSVGQDDQKLAALQFAGKLHELLMLASIATIVFAYIRRELCFGEGIPYGVLSAGLDVENLSFLYSPELWSAAWAHWYRRRNKWILIILLVFCTLLAVTVGPSTNNLMRPRLKDWPAGGTKFWVSAPQSVLLPDQLDSSPQLEHCLHDTGDLACPYGDWRLIESQYHAYWPRLQPMGSMPETINLNSPLSRRTMTLRQRRSSIVNGIDTRAIWDNINTVASTQHSVLSDALNELARLWSYTAANHSGKQRFEFRKDAKFKVTAPQPVTQTRCWARSFTDPRTVALDHLAFPNLLGYTGCSTTATENCLYEDVSQFTITKNATFLAVVKDLLQQNSQPSLLWVDDGEAKPENSSITAVAAFPSTNAGDTKLFACTIDLKIAHTELESRRNDVKGTAGYPNAMLVHGTSPPDWHRVQITPTWARLLNPSISYDNPSMTAFSSMAAVAGVWNNSLPAKEYDYTRIVESVLNAMVVNGAARQTYNDSMVGTLRGPTNPLTQWEGGEWTKYFFPSKGLGFNGPQSIFNEPVHNLDNTTATANTSSMYIMYAHVNGYAWTPTGKAQLAAIVTLGFYVFLASAHVIVSVWDKKSSSAWDSVPEMVALAAQSRPAPPLQNTGAGIHTVGPLKQKVRIRNINGHLEYIFDETASMTGSPVKLNQKYG